MSTPLNGPIKECLCCRMMLNDRNTTGYCTTFCEDTHNARKPWYKDVPKLGRPVKLTTSTRAAVQRMRVDKKKAQVAERRKVLNGFSNSIK